MTKVLVTGANGFIGKQLVDALVQLDLAVISYTHDDGDIAEEDTWKKLPVVDYVFHLAGRSFVPDSWNDPAGFIQTNVNGTGLALDYCKLHGARLIFLSAYLYGVPTQLPISEAEPVSPNNPYALSKHLAEKLCKFYSSYWKVPVTIIRPFNVFGSGQRSEFLIPKIINQVRNSDEICVMDLEPKRDYIYVKDLVNALVKTINLNDGFNFFNIGSGKSYSVRELIDIIQRAARTDLPIRSEYISREQEIPDVRADITRANNQLGWVPKFTFADGIHEILHSELIKSVTV